MQHVRLPLLIATASASCVKHLPPAPTPAPIAPAIPAGAPPAGDHGRLVVDVVDGQVPVKRVRMVSEPFDNGRGRVSYLFKESPEVLCPAAPCITDIPRGNLLLGFPVIGNPDATEVELVHVGPEPSVYRRTLSVYEDKTGGLRVSGVIATAIGGAAAITGTVLLPVGLAGDSGGLAAAGGISLGAGAALLVFGIWAIRHDAPSYRPGSSNHFPLGAASP